jgi:hypothetical protein
MCARRRDVGCYPQQICDYSHPVLEDLVTKRPG